MDKTPRYAIDTCSLTELRRVYPSDVVPGAWDVISEMAYAGIIISSHEIYLELEAQDDDVYKWAQNHKEIFLPLDDDIQIKATEILRNYPNILDLRQQKSSADPFLIATAIINSCSLVTEEKPVGPGSLRIKIPNVCRSLKVNNISLLEMLRLEGVRLELRRS